MVQWLRKQALHAGAPSSIPAQGTKIPHAATKSSYAAMKIEDLSAATKTQCSQINKENIFKGFPY